MTRRIYATLTHKLPFYLFRSGLEIVGPFDSPAEAWAWQETTREREVLNPVRLRTWRKGKT